ncbi:MAG: DUF2807 domain-containing protein [Spirochaetales bacterium]|nr:DUF2807 domain-containing protein [Spirochaetales bacterium]
MKNSTKFILIVLAAIALLIASLTVISRNIVNDHLVIMKGDEKTEINFNGNEDLRVEREWDFSGFDEIKISGGWDILIISDDEYRITVNSYDSDEANYEVSEAGGKLRLNMKNLIVAGRMHGASATIYMPELKKVDVDGAVNINIEGFIQDSFSLKLDGAGSITGEDCDFKNFKLVSNGAINIDFDESEIENAEVYLGGAGNVQLNMTGGVLEGQLDGIANLEYSGEVSRLAVEKDGIGSISRKD